MTTPAPRTHSTLLAYLGLAGLALASVAAPAAAQWSTTYESMYLPGRFNWQFRHNYPAADRLFNAFDYGHAILYEKLWTRPSAPVSELEEREYDYITRQLLVRPPKLPLEESAIEVEYAKLVPEAKAMFDWAHLFHRQVYDAWADERIAVADKDSLVARLLRYYKSRRDLAFSSKPKSMELMEGQPYSLAFRQRYPKFNGLIWAYHWLQVGLYEPLVAGRDADERQTGVLAAVARFRQMIENAPEGMPRVMPMTAAIAPAFAARYPEAAIIFDNLHSMHDVVSDILANPDVPRERKRDEILRAARSYRDSTTEVQTVDEWRSMAVGMGVENMGGPALNLLAAAPVSTAERGATMDHSRMHAPAPAADSAAARPSEHAHHEQPPPSAATNDSAAVAATVGRFHDALARGDSTAALALLSQDVVVLESGGAESLAEYRAHHLPADIEFARAVPAQRSPVTVRVRGSTAWATSTTTTRGEFRGRAIDSAGAELMVLSREGGTWRISAIHWSSRARRAPGD